MASTHDMPNSPTPPLAAKTQFIEIFQGALAFYTILLATAVGLHAMDVFLINTAMPVIVGDLGGQEFYAWPAMLYLVSSIIGATAAGPVTGNLGARKGYLMAGWLFLLGTVGCSLSPTMGVFLIARFVQGLGGGLILALSMTFIRRLYPRELNTRILSMISAVWSIAALAGPLIGGIFASAGFWRGAFLATLPAIILFLILSWMRLPQDVSEGARLPRQWPMRRIGLLSFGVSLIGYAGIVEGSNVMVAFLCGIAMLMSGLSFYLDRHSTGHRLFPRRAFSLADPVGAVFWVLLLIGLGHAPIGIYVPLLLTKGYGITPLIAGFAAAGLAFGWTAASFATAALKGRIRLVGIVLGLCLTMISLLALAQNSGGFPILGIIGLTALMGLGLGAANIHLMSLVMQFAHKGEEDLSAAGISTMRLLGVAFGAAIAGLLGNLAGLKTAFLPEDYITITDFVFFWMAVALAIATGIAIRLAMLVHARMTAA